MSLMLDSAKCRSLGVGLSFGCPFPLLLQERLWGASLGLGATPTRAACRELRISSVMSRGPVSSAVLSKFLTEAQGLGFDLQIGTRRGVPPEAEVTPAARPSQGQRRWGDGVLRNEVELLL